MVKNSLMTIKNELLKTTVQIKDDRKQKIKDNLLLRSKPKFYIYLLKQNLSKIINDTDSNNFRLYLLFYL